MKYLICSFIFISSFFITILPTFAEEKKLLEDLPKLKRNTEAISISIGTVYYFKPILGFSYLRADFDLTEKLTIGTSYGIGSGSYTRGFLLRSTENITGGIETVSVHGKYYFFGADINNFFTETTITSYFNFATPFKSDSRMDSKKTDFDKAYGSISQLLGYEFSSTYFKLVAKAGLSGIGSKSSSGGGHPFLGEIGSIFDFSLGFIF